MQPLVSSSLIRPGSLRRHCLCQAGKQQQQQQPISNKATQGPPDVTNQMEDMEDVIMIDEDEDDEVMTAMQCDCSVIIAGDAKHCSCSAVSAGVQVGSLQLRKQPGCLLHDVL